MTVRRGRRASAGEVEEYVKHRVDRYADFDWYFCDAFPLCLLRSAVDGTGPSDGSPRGWLKWLKRERALEGSWGNDFALWWVTLGIKSDEGTVICVEQRDGFGVEDGNHRVAVSHELEIDVVSAYVGYLRRRP